MTARELRSRIVENCDIIRTILSFNYSLDPCESASLDRIRAAAATATKHELRTLHQNVSDDLLLIARRFGCKQKPREFANEFAAACIASSDLANISKAVIDSDYFSNFGDGHPAWELSPPHLRVIVYCNRVVPDRFREIDYFLPEATLYEDMALAYNKAIQLERQPPARTEGADPKVKEFYLYLRTSLLSAFYFVEAYLNGIAFDFHYRKAHSLPSQMSDLLLEWDSKNQRHNFVSFERKVKEYPKIIMGTKDPPFTITNCPSLSLLLGSAKEYRDSIVHQSPKVTDVSQGAIKVRTLLQLRMPQVTEVVDAAVDFVLRLNETLGPEAFPIPWLLRRDAAQDGLFPDQAFR